MNRKKSAKGKSPTTKSKHGRRKADAGPEGRTIKEKAPSKKAARPVGRNSFPIVGVGASAGGLEAFTRLLKHLQPATGMGSVLFKHLAPVQESPPAKLVP